MKHLLIVIIALVIGAHVDAQPLNKKKQYTLQDTLRGSLNPERTWWDVLHYDITVRPDYIRKSITGLSVITFKTITPGKVMQIDLQEPMKITQALWNGKALTVQQEGNAWHITFPETPEENSITQIAIRFSGKPREAVNPPWDGGWIWRKDVAGNPWMSVACQGLGASVWYPCKDHLSDEPDHGALLRMTADEGLTAVGNGRLKEKQTHNNGETTWIWEVKNPINNYNIIPYIGKYVNFTEVYQGEKGPLDCSYWVLEENLEKAKEQFKQVKAMLACFEGWFGPYPFYEDGYKLIESPHLGMEHQSGIAYGNHYEQGYRGRDLSGSGWGMKWDFIIIHESGHEWFGNNITNKDIADMWIHESFTNYSETLFVECLFTKKAGSEYVIGTRKNIQNDIPVIGVYGLNQEGSGDMYYKGANMIHTIRQLVNDDSKFKAILRGLNEVFYHQTVTTKQVEDYISAQTGINLDKIFDQYLRTTQIPVLEYKTTHSSVSYRWTNCVEGFDMPVKVDLGKVYQLQPLTTWTKLELVDGYDGEKFEIDQNFYVDKKKVNK